MTYRWVVWLLCLCFYLFCNPATQTDLLLLSKLCVGHQFCSSAVLSRVSVYRYNIVHFPVCLLHCVFFPVEYSFTV